MEEKNEMLEQTNESENVETQATEEFEEGIELTDTAGVAKSDDVGDATSSKEMAEEEKAEVKKSLRELLRENEDYQEEYESMLKSRLDRQDKKYQKELSKYRDTDNVLRTTLNLKDGDDTNTKLREYYEAEGIKLPEAIKPGLSSRQIEVLAEDEAKQIIEAGFEEMESEANRLANIGYKNLNESEKIIFNKLAEKLTEEKNRKELLKLGAKEELLKDKDFIEFKNQFNATTPMEKIYDLYTKINNKKTVKENPGSMKNIETSKYKDFYTPEELAKLTEEDLEDPKVWEAARKSMTNNTYKNYYE